MRNWIKSPRENQGRKDVRIGRQRGLIDKKLRSRLSAFGGAGEILRFVLFGGLAGKLHNSPAQFLHSKN
jgi:hypothetical protein